MLGDLVLRIGHSKRNEKKKTKVVKIIVNLEV